MRKQRVHETAKKIIREGRRPSADAIAEQLDYSLPDTHRCLNILEKEGLVETYRKNVLGSDYRMVSVERQ
ncbi:MAG: helix-turn-helix domain-containing protein [Candidatus Aenigmatarchaeota archaeon]